MSILLWITIEMEYKIKRLKFILFFTNGRQKLTAKGLTRTPVILNSIWKEMTFNVSRQCKVSPHIDITQKLISLSSVG